ncbi:hypothetical protein WH96_00655 [Kiloniella spongiae]|uniref:UspA domain-containing protein n=1 Tax=Kiloniella spongiae TaxID=1489064 RepID=A0A0H2MMU6_9PROT|nr:universal stress protein [Kiloniella spongiae]KLN62087.1 hypothetical protein WH96_00655 [Kiloniella spongiae]
MEPAITDILFASDLSQNAKVAMEKAVQFSQMSGAKLHILHVVERISSDAEITMRLYFPDPVLRI